MRPKAVGSIVIGALITVYAGSSLAAVADERDACSLLTQARVSCVMAVSMGNGVHPGEAIPDDHPHDPRQCVASAGRG